MSAYYNNRISIILLGFVFVGSMLLTTTCYAVNLLTNPGFESGDKFGWLDKSTWNGTGFVVAQNAFLGTYSLQITGNSNRWPGVTQEIAVTEGRTYDASAWLKVENITTGQYVVHVRWYSVNNEEIIDTRVWVGSKKVNTNGYVNLSKSFIAPVGAVTAKLYLQANLADGSGYFDNLNISQTPGAIAYYDVNQNPMPGAQVTTTYNHNAGGRGITPYYGYYVSEFPSLNDYGLIAGRTDLLNSPDPMIRGRSSGQAAVWENGVTKNIYFSACRDSDGDGVADSTVCGSRALAISNLGKVGGSSHVNLAGRDTYFEQNRSWWPNEAGEYDNGGSRDLSFYSSSQSQIEDVNSQSNVVGMGITLGGSGPQDGMAHGLVKIKGGSDYIGIQYQYSRAHALNENNLVTGAINWNATDDYSSGVPRSLKAYTWLSGTLNVVQDGITDPAHISEGFDVNDSGLVVGQMGWSNNIRAFKWSSPSGSLEDIGTLGGDQSVARSVNNSGTIVGWANTLDTTKHAFIYKNGTMYDLNDYASGASGFVIVDAYSINEAGQLLVRAYNALTNQNQYWLLTDPDSLPPTPPEPLPVAAEVTFMGVFGGEKYEEPIKIMADGEGNTISIGYFNKDGYIYGSDLTIDFDPTLAEDIQTVSGEGAYIQKLDANGNYLWTKMLLGKRVGNSSRINDLFVEPDGSFHIVGVVETFGTLDLDPDPDVEEILSGSSRIYRGNLAFRASYSSNGELVSSAVVDQDMKAYSVAVDIEKNIYVAYFKRSRGGMVYSDSLDTDFDPGVGVANVRLYYGRPAIVVTKTSRDFTGTARLEWAKSMSSVGKYCSRCTPRYEDGYARIVSLSIAAPAVTGEGPMLAFAYNGAINFQVFDSNVGLVGAPQEIDTAGLSRTGYVRMAELGEPSVFGLTPGESNKVTLVRSGSYYGLLAASGRDYLLFHGLAAKAGISSFSRVLNGSSKGIAMNQQGDVYISGYVGDPVNFDATGYDVQGRNASYVTKINSDGSYGWTFSHQRAAYWGYTSVAVNSFGSITTTGNTAYGALDQNGNLLPVYGGRDVLVTRIVPLVSVLPKPTSPPNLGISFP